MPRGEDWGCSVEEEKESEVDVREIKDLAGVFLVERIAERDEKNETYALCGTKLSSLERVRDHD